jgi:TonB family protein
LNALTSSSYLQPSARKRVVRICSGTLCALVVLCVSVFGQGGQHNGKFWSYEWSAVDNSGKQFSEREFRNRRPPWNKDVTKAVPPEYPYEERNRKHTGAGLFRMDIDPETGSVTKVSVVKSTEYNRLDEAAKHALVQWRFRPSSWKELSLPVNFVSPSQVRYLSR